METNLEEVKEEKQLAVREKEAAILMLECNICFEVKDENHALVPCGHVMCSECVSSCSKCPTCARQVTSHLRLYN